MFQTTNQMSLYPSRVYLEHPSLTPFQHVDCMTSWWRRLSWCSNYPGASMPKLFDGLCNWIPDGMTEKHKNHKQVRSLFQLWDLSLYNPLHPSLSSSVRLQSTQASGYFPRLGNCFMMSCPGPLYKGFRGPETIACSIKNMARPAVIAIYQL